MDSQSLVFEYFFQIGAGLASGIAFVIVPSILVIRFILHFIAHKMKKGEVD